MRLLIEKRLHVCCKELEEVFCYPDIMYHKIALSKIFQ